MKPELCGDQNQIQQRRITFNLLSENLFVLLQAVRTVPGLRHVLDNGTIIFPPFPATELEPTIHEQELCQLFFGPNIFSRYNSVQIFLSETPLNISDTLVDRNTDVLSPTLQDPSSAEWPKFVLVSLKNTTSVTKILLT